MSNLPFTIAVDADGVLWEDAYPGMGLIRPKTIEALIYAQAEGAVLILNTCRTGDLLAAALESAETAWLEFDYANANDPRRIEAFGGDCRKISADLYVEDKGVGWPGDDEAVASAIYAAVRAWLEAQKRGLAETDAKKKGD